MRTATRAPIALAAAALVAASGCDYAFRNPAEVLVPGEASGRTMAGTSVAVDGASVSVKGSGLSGVSRQNGSFTILPLPVGRHTLLFRKGTERALQREVEISLGKDGQPQGVWMGDVVLLPTVTLAGSVRLPAVPTVQATLPTGGLVVDQESGAVAPVAGDGSYVLPGLPVGTHHLRFYATGAGGREFVGGPLLVHLAEADAGTRKVLSRADLHLAVPASILPSTVTFRVAIAGEVPGLTLPALRLAGLPAPATVGADGRVRVAVREGLWTVGLSLPASVTAATPPPTVTFAAVAGEEIDLGTLLVVSDAAQQWASRACRSDAECAPADGCLPAGVCGPQWQPPPGVPASVPFCAAPLRACVAGQPLLTGGPFVTVSCVASGQAVYPVACGACCTPDGLQSLCAVPGQGGCPVLPPSGGTATGHVVSGTLSGSAAAGTTVVLTDEASLVRQAVSGSNGAFTFADVADGTYLVAPSSPVAFFTPSFATITVAGADVTGVDFVGTALPSFTISGNVTDPATGAAVPGVVLTLTAYGSGSVTTATSDAAGTFSLAAVQGDAYTLTPAAPGLVFRPPSATFVLGTDIVATFSASPRPAGTHLLSGHVTTSTGAPALGGHVGVFGPAVEEFVPVGVDGAWFLDGLADGAYDLQPQLPGHVFTPTARQATLSGADLGGLDFVASPSASGFFIAGRLAGLASAGVVMTLTGGGLTAPQQVTTDTVGGYAFTGLAAGTYTVTPAPGSYLWSPPASTFTVGPDVASADFVAWPVGCVDCSIRYSWPQPQGNPLNAVWGSSASDVWAVGDAGATIHYDGSAWSASFNGALASFRSVWGAAANDVWAVGDGGTITRYNGSFWSSVASGTSANLRGVWGTGAGDVWAVGDAVILHHDGASWSSGGYTGSALLRAVWGTGTGDVWAAGSDPATGEGVFLHYTVAAGWVSAQTVGEAITALWGTGTGDAWAAGAAGGLYRLSAAAGTWAAGPQAAVTDQLATGWSFGGSDGWTAGRTSVQHWNGNLWASADPPGPFAVRGLWGSSSADVWAVGEGGAAYHWTGSTWSAANGGTASTTSLRAAWAASGTDAWAAGEGTLLRWNGITWTASTPPGQEPPNGLWGSSSSDVWMVGQLGDVAYHWTGSAWGAVALPNAAANALLAVSGSGSGDVWAVGLGPALLHHDGAGWATSPHPATGALTGVWARTVSDAWAVGPTDIIRWDGFSWSAVALPADFAPAAVWATAGNDAWCVGTQPSTGGGAIAHWDGLAWTVVSGSLPRPLRGVGGAGPGGAFALGDGGLLLTMSGTAWVQVSSPTVNGLRAVAAASPTLVFLVGDGNTILRYGF